MALKEVTTVKTAQGAKAATKKAWETMDLEVQEILYTFERDEDVEEGAEAQKITPKVVGGRLINDNFKVKLVVVVDDVPVRVTYRITPEVWNRHKMESESDLFILEGKNARIRGLQRIDKDEKYPFTLANGEDTHKWDSPYYHTDSIVIKK